MLKRFITSLVVLPFLVVTSSSAQNAQLRGRIIDNNNSPVQGAQVRLIRANRSQTTDWEGRFTIETNMTGVMRSSMPPDMITYRNGALFFRPGGAQ